MTVKKQHSSPMEYRIRYRVSDSLSENTQYYNVFHSSEALDFLSHTLERGQLDADRVKIIAVEEYNRFSKKWENRTTKAAEHASSALLNKQDELWLVKKS